MTKNQKIAAVRHYNWMVQNHYSHDHAMAEALAHGREAPALHWAADSALVFFGGLMGMIGGVVLAACGFLLLGLVVSLGGALAEAYFWLAPLGPTEFPHGGKTFDERWDATWGRPLPDPSWHQYVEVEGERVLCAEPDAVRLLDEGWSWADANDPQADLLEVPEPLSAKNIEALREAHRPLWVDQVALDNSAAEAWVRPPCPHVLAGRHEPVMDAPNWVCRDCDMVLGPIEYIKS